VSERGRILLADDEDTLLQSTADLLRREGYDVEYAPDADAALSLLKAQEFDLLFSNIRMPGNQDLAFIRNVPSVLPGLPVMLMTAFPSLDYAIQPVEIPVAAFIVKPFDIPEFLAKVSLPSVRRAVSELIQRIHDGYDYSIA